ncbi:MAG: putative lipid II flippase FtsW [Candidatus Cloacimonetes bacterium]|nr:putative lipid II flippase FtsW [Candidatus Cloacimonadota bacterium]
MSRAAAAPRSHTDLNAPTLARLSRGWEAPVLLLLAVALLSFGLVAVYSASAVKAQTDGLADYHFVIRQAIGGSLGLLLLAVMAYLDYRVLRLFAWPMLLVVIGLLVFVLLPGTESVAPRVNGGRRWIDLGVIQGQPSELAKLVLIIWTAAVAVRKQDRLSSLSKGLLPFLLVWGTVATLIMMQPSMSAAALVVLLAALVLFAGGARVAHFVVLGALMLPFLLTQVSGVGYRMRRILAFIDPTHDPAGVSYQITQALIALGSGGLLGRGLGHGQQKFGFLPEPHNDFIFAMIGEEWGFVGMALLVLGYVAIALIGYRIARNAPDLFGSLLAIGVTNLIVVQALLHMAVNSALIPTTGVTLPFISYGGSSLIVCMAAVGILMNIARRSSREAE